MRCHQMSFEISFMPPISQQKKGRGRPQWNTSVTFHSNVCSKMMASTWNKCHATCFKWMLSFYYIHCSETWHLCEWHTFHCRQPWRKEFQWEAWNLFHMTSDGATHFNVTEPLRCILVLKWRKNLRSGCICFQLCWVTTSI